MTRKYFGTDGIRGVVGEMPITPEFILKLGWAAGKVFASQGETKVLIGKDTRISGYMFESALEAGLAAAGVDVRLLGPMPTPAIAYLTRTFGAAAGIVISASHNPYHDNGIKFFSSVGQKLPDEVELEIEKQLEEDIRVVPSEKVGKAARIIDARGRYIEFCKGTISKGLSLKGLRIVVDCANGACYDIAPSVLDELGAEVIAIGCKPDGININLDCGSTKPAALQQKVIESRADLGIALDGDGDRLVMVDAGGNLVDGDQLLYIIAKDLLDRGKFRGGVAGTLMSNLGLELAFKSMDIPFVRAKVGDRYVMEELAKHSWSLGGESSGHLICLNHTTTGDGIVAAMQVLAAMVRSGKPLAELASGMEVFPQTMVNVKLSRKKDVGSIAEVKEAVQAANERLDGKGRVLLRPSGTEPLIRVMVEGEDGELVEKLAHEIAGVVEKAVGTA